MPPTQIIHCHQKRTSINLLGVACQSAVEQLGILLPFHLANRDGVGRGSKSQQTDEKEQLEAIPYCGNLFNFMAQRTGEATDVPAKCNLKRASK